ncbi:unnamed protein product [Anisakis simplex]|uniref:Secreted protein n=1 Tax=Anisakis simplex TaxID=6269 RepID=A0A0M3KC40_ANISI|nr:unnamed protein product [Anisakis simplex]
MLSSQVSSQAPQSLILYLVEMLTSLLLLQTQFANAQSRRCFLCSDANIEVGLELGLGSFLSDDDDWAIANDFLLSDEGAVEAVIDHDDPLIC